MFYREFLPTEKLKPFIHIYGILGLEHNLEKPMFAFAPPSLYQGILFYYRREASIHKVNGPYDDILPLSFIMAHGLNANRWTISKQFGLFTVIFKPGKLRYFFPLNAWGFMDNLITLEELNDPDLLGLHDQIANADSVGERIESANRCFEKRLRKVGPRDDLIDEMIDEIIANPNMKISEVLQDFPMCQRNIRRLFSKEIGIPPKKFQARLRITQAAESLKKRPGIGMAELAFRLGYCDEAHFIREFKRVVRMTPKQFALTINPMADLINFERMPDSKKKIGLA